MSTAKPLATSERLDNYVRQNHSQKLTPAQLRRADKKARHHAAKWQHLAGTTR